MVLGAILVIVVGLILYSSGPAGVNNGGPNLNAGPVVGTVTSEALGTYLTDTEGRTLYVFADDKKLESVCEGQCLQNWPPFIYDNKDLASFPDMLSKRMNVIIAKDKKVQYAYGEKPLYYYKGDTKPGEVLGNGMGGGKWSIVLVTE